MLCLSTNPLEAMTLISGSAEERYITNDEKRHIEINLKIESQKHPQRIEIVYRTGV